MRFFYRSRLLLGLVVGLVAISKSLAMAMGGETGVRSELDKGSTFWFTARLGLGSQDTLLSPSALALHGERVLVVDDNEPAALVVSTLLLALGFQVDTVHSGAMAIERVHTAGERPYAFVMMDWQMPGMDGLQTVEALRQSGTQGLPFVLMVTAHRPQDVQRNAARLGIDHVLSKPLTGSSDIITMLQILGRVQQFGPQQEPARAAVPIEHLITPLAGAWELVVEDNEINQQVACEILNAAGLETDVAENGHIALHRIAARQMEGRPYDIVLMDMQMPVMDGITATRRIRETTAADVLPAGFDALMQRLRNVPELKVDLCLSRTNNNPAFYVSLLRRFIPTQRDAAESIQRALNGGDRLQAERLAHTLKGVAASLGADELQERAGLLEENIHQGVSTPEIQAKQLQLADALERLMQHLLAAELVESETPAPTTPMDAQEQCKAQGIVVQVKSLLKQNDANALTVWEQHQALLRRLLPDAGRIEGAIYAFEMELAIELLQEASAPKSA